MAKDEQAASEKALTTLLENLVDKLNSSTLGADQLQAILSKVGLETAAGMQKALRPENEMPPLMSAFNPEGDRDFPKPKLKRLTFFNDHREHSADDGTADMLTKAEILSYNELGDVAAAGNGLLEARNGQYTAEIRNRGRELHVTVKGLSKLDTQSNLPPSLLLLCHEIRTGESMRDVNSLLEEVTRLRAELGLLRGPNATIASKPTTPPTITAQAGPLAGDLAKALDETPFSTVAGGR